MARLDRSSVQAGLSTRVFGRNLTVQQRTASTNDVAKEMAVDGAPEGTVVVAEEQTAGRGRLKRRWEAPPKTCLLCSILFRPQGEVLMLSRTSWLTMLCSLAAADAIEKVAGLEVALKWPNDLIVKSRLSTSDRRAWRKLAGILTETGVTESRVDFAIVGIGVNVNVPPDLLPGLAPNATSILAETGQEVGRAALLAALLNDVERRYQELRSGKSPHAEWAARLATLGKRVRAATPDGVLIGVAEAVGEDGALLLRAADGECHRLLAGDVTLNHFSPSV